MSSTSIRPTTCSGTSAVVSTIGAGRYLRRVVLYSQGIANVIRSMDEHGVARLIAISSGGTRPGWDRNTPAFYELLIKRVLLRGEYRDMRHMEAVIRDSDLAWTILRPSWLSDVAGTGDYRTKVGYSFPERSTTTRDDLAAFIVEELETDGFLREGVAIVSG